MSTCRPLTNAQVAHETRRVRRLTHKAPRLFPEEAAVLKAANALLRWEERRVKAEKAYVDGPESTELEDLKRLDTACKAHRRAGLRLLAATRRLG